MNRRTLLITATLALIVAASVGASLFLVPTNIDATNKFSWSENAGWMNWADANGGADGVFVAADFLSGYVWMENVGWLNAGDGNGPYANTDDTNFGVNIQSNGDLAGYAWGENIGWINFDTSSHAPDQARFDGAAGRFRGYAWAENIGWINLDDADHFVEVTPQSPLPDSINPDKTRFISFSVSSEQQVAIRVRLTSLHHVNPPYTDGASIPFTSFEFGASCAEAGGCVRWVGPPEEYVESTGTGTPFYGSKLQCTPHYQDWSTVGLLHVTGSAVVPSSAYEVESVSVSCTGSEPSCTAVSPLLSIGTTRWGDVETPYNPPSPTTQPDLGDIAALVNKFEGAPTAAIKARTLLAGTDAFGNVNLDVDVSFDTIAVCVDAFRGKPYPYTISSCP